MPGTWREKVMAEGSSTSSGRSRQLRVSCPLAGRMPPAWAASEPSDASFPVQCRPIRWHVDCQRTERKNLPKHGAGTSDDRRHASCPAASPLVVLVAPATAVRATIGSRSGEASQQRHRSPQAPTKGQTMKKDDATIKPFKMDEVKEAMAKADAEAMA